MSSEWNTLPAGCEEALRAIDIYNRTAGSTRLSQDAAASQAYRSMMDATLDTDGGTAHAVTVALSGDFFTMRSILEGQLSGDYAAAVAQTNSDIRTLNDVCASR